MSTLALFRDGRQGEGDRDCWATPLGLFNRLDKAIGPFTLDACALPYNAKCARYYTPEIDGLVQPWHEDAAGGVVWCNPPFSAIRRWVAKAWRESLRGARVALLMPANRTDAWWFHRYVIEAGAAIQFLEGRTRFVPPPGVLASSPGFGCLVALYGYQERGSAAAGGG